MNNIIEKRFWQSKTIWFNVLAFVIFVLDLVLKTNLIVDKNVLAIMVAVLNLALRFKTDRGIY